MELINPSSSSTSSTSDYSSSSDHNNCRSNGEKIKGPWSAEEDRILTRLVDKHGPRNWSLISRYIRGRSGKSCRLRWCNQLSPAVEHRPFSAAEDDAILAAHAEYGNRWATIARLLPGRTDNAVKNHWNSTLKRRRRGASHVLRLPHQQELARAEPPQMGSSCSDGRELEMSGGGGSGSGAAEDFEDPFTALTLAPPGAAAAVVESHCGSTPPEFWDAMRGVIAREVREYVTTSFPGAES